MFYSQFILAKKGPLGTIWIAAHLERKLRKNQVAETDIGVTVDSILFPEVPIALRLSGHLLLGVVRIYSRQVNYLFNDCSETLGKIKQAFHSADVDLPPEATTAPFHTITLPETFDFDELELVPDSESSFLHLNGHFVDQHVTTREQITLQDTVDHNPYLGSSQFGLDERFGDGSYFSFGLDFDEEFSADKSGASTSSTLPKEETFPIRIESSLENLLKENVAGPSVCFENEAVPMEVDDCREPVKPGCHDVSLPGERAKAVLGSPERENCPSTSVQAIDPLIEHADSQVSLRTEFGFAHKKYDTPGFQAYTPHVLEACTPDLNQEYCPPDEPSTPALVDETSLPMHKEFTVENTGRTSPPFAGHSERITASPGSLPPLQVESPWVPFNEASRNLSNAPYQGFALHQAASVNETNGVLSNRSENAQEALVQENLASAKGNATAAYTAFPSFAQQAFLQEGRTDVQYEGLKSPANASDSSGVAARASLPQSNSNLLLSVNSQWGNISNHVENAAAVTAVMESTQVHSAKENAAAVSTVSSSFSQQAFGPLSRTDALHEGSDFPANACDFLGMASGASLTQSNSTLMSSANSQRGNTLKHVENAPTLTTIVETAQILTNREIAAAVSTTLPAFPEAAFLQQSRTDVLHEGHKLSANASDTLGKASAASFAHLNGSLLSSVNSQQGNTSNHVENATAVTSVMESAHVSSVKENAAAVSTAFPSFPQQAFLQQSRTEVVHGAPPFLANASDSSLTAPGASLTQFNGNSLSSVNGQWSLTSDHAIPAPLQQQRHLTDPFNLQPSVEIGTGTPCFRPPSTLLNTVTGGQGSTAQFASPSCVSPPLFARTGSYPPMENVFPSRHMEHIAVDKNSAATEGPPWQPAVQQCNTSLFVINGPSISPMAMEKCETLRSAYDQQNRSASFSLLQKGMSHDRMPGLELDRNTFRSPSIDGATKELLLPESEGVFGLKGETPFTTPRAPVLSTPSFNSVPGDEDVLASILGRRTQAFKVIPTLMVQKPPKPIAVNRRPKLLSRATPKRRKVELDTVAVLHGDVIRQQLASAEDIRRERRKAPCTRREVWGFLRECESQENFDEPTLPEISSELLDLYHDVLLGHESRPRPISGAELAKQAPLEAVKDDFRELDNAEDTDLLANFVKKISTKDACSSQVAGACENDLSENIAKRVFANEDAYLNQGMGNVENCLLDNSLEQPKEVREEEVTAQRISLGDLVGAEDAKMVRAHEASGIGAGTEVLDGKEGQALSFPDAQVTEDASSEHVNEIRTDEQGAQASELQRELETLLVSEFSEGDQAEVVIDQGGAVIMQQDNVGTAEQNLPTVEVDKQAAHESLMLVEQDNFVTANQNLPSVGADKQTAQESLMLIDQDNVGTARQNLLSVGVDKQAAHEKEIDLSKEDVNLQALSIPSGGKDAAEMTVFHSAGVDTGDAEEVEVKTNTSPVFEEETHQNSNDEEMAAAEPEGDAELSSKKVPTY
ncbi:hypothetical protein L7F22_030758 [Adiantum nelumboides]|nr:hypothetical protein [Adiantum nelumboides]